MFKVLACIDASPYANSVCDLSAWAAERLSASVELLHVVQRKSAVSERHDLSGAIGLGVKSELLEELTRIEEAQGRLAIETGRALLAAAQERLLATGVNELTLVHRHGGIVETILEREVDCDLVIMGKRGASAEFATAHLGSKIERVLRASKKPVFITPYKVGVMKRVVLAYDGGASAKRALDLVISSSLFQGLELHIVMAGEDNQRNRSEIEAVRGLVADSGASATVPLSSGSPQAVISEYMSAYANSVLVMGAYGHSPLRNLIVGSTTTSMIRTINDPILLIR